MYVYIHIYVYIHTYNMYVCIYICMYICICVCVHIKIASIYHAKAISDELHDSHGRPHESMPDFLKAHILKSTLYGDFL